MRLPHISRPIALPPANRTPAEPRPPPLPAAHLPALCGTCARPSTFALSTLMCSGFELSASLTQCTKKVFRQVHKEVLLCPLFFCSGLRGPHTGHLPSLSPSHSPPLSPLPTDGVARACVRATCPARTGSLRCHVELFKNAHDGCCCGSRPPGEQCLQA